MRLKKLWAIPAIALGLLATQLSPAKASIGHTTNYDWEAGSYMAKANNAYLNECTSGPWLKAEEGAYDGFYFLAMAGHCVYASPSSVSSRADFAKFYSRSLNSGSTANWYDTGSVFRPGGSEWKYDIVLVGPFDAYPASNIVMDYCQVSGNSVCTGPNGSGTDWPAAAGNTTHPGGVSPRRKAMDWEITPGIQSPTDDVIGTDACITGIRMGTNCGLNYGKANFTGNGGGLTDWVTPAYKIDMDEANCGARGGDSSGPVWLDIPEDATPEVLGAERAAAVGGLLLGSWSQATDTESKCYGVGVTPTVGFDLAWIGIDDIRVAFPTFDLSAVTYLDNVNECFC